MIYLGIRMDNHKVYRNRYGKTFLCKTFNGQPPRPATAEVKLLDFIRLYFRDIGRPPTFEEMRRALGFKSKWSIFYYLGRLRQMGLVEYRKYKTGTLRLVNDEH